MGFRAQPVVMVAMKAMKAAAMKAMKAKRVAAAAPAMKAMKAKRVAAAPAMKAMKARGVVAERQWQLRCTCLPAHLVFGDRPTVLTGRRGAKPPTFGVGCSSEGSSCTRRFGISCELGRNMSETQKKKKKKKKKKKS